MTVRELLSDERRWCPQRCVFGVSPIRKTVLQWCPNADVMRVLEVAVV